MSIETITAKITDEAQTQHDAVLTDAREKADAILASARDKAQKLLDSEDARGKAEEEKLISRRRSVADIDSRKRMLAEKQALIEQCFAETTDAIIGGDRETYFDVLVAMGRAAGLTEGTLLFNAREKDDIGPRVAAALNESLPPGAKGFAVGEATAPVKGGYLLMAGDMTINNTIEALVAESRSDLEGQVAAMLFPREAGQ